MYEPPNQPGMFQGPPPTPSRKQRPIWRIIVIVGGSLVLLLIICGVIGSFLPKTPATTVSTSTTPTQAPTPTQLPTATTIPTTTPTLVPTVASTPTPKPTTNGITATNGIPHIGGPISDFIGKYGKLTSSSVINTGRYDFDQTNDPATSTDGFIVNTALNTSGPNAFSTTVDSVTATAINSEVWTASDAQTICMQFSPTDAHLKQHLVFADGYGYDLVYFSASLAHLFPASEFTDTNGNNVTPGYFDVQYLYTSDKQHIDDCTILTGEQQTNGQCDITNCLEMSKP